VANAPCSWGALEFDATQLPAPASQVLDEMAAAGYAGTELGDWGFLPTAPVDLAATVGRRNLALVAAFVPVALARADALDEGRRASRPYCAAALGSERAGCVPRALRRQRQRGEPDPSGRTYSRRRGVDRRSVDGFRAARRTGGGGGAARGRSPHGLSPSLRRYVETPHEIDALCSRTDPTLLGLCLDTGLLAFAGGDPVAALAAWGDRIWHVHFKDCDPDLAKQSRNEGWDYHESVRRGIFCELGRGTVPFARVLDALRARGYNGWIVVEQDVLPGLGTPAASATRNRDYLRGLGI
jgi:Sugar phosphate isomerases/epimerases